MRGHIAGDDSRGSHHGVSANPYAGEDYAARAKTGAGFDTSLHQPRLTVAIAPGDRGQWHSRASRKQVVGKAYPRTDKDIIVDRHPVPHHRLVFNGDPVANLRTGFKKSVITDIAIAADYGALHDVREGPYSGARANLLALAERIGVNKDISPGAHCTYAAPSLIGTQTLSREMLSSAASIMRTTRNPLAPSARGFPPERMHSKKSSTSASSGSFD
jgi:hypothetical protein